MSIITDDLQQTISVDGITYEIDTDFRELLRYEKIMQDTDASAEVKARCISKIVHEFVPTSHEEIAEMLNEIFMFWSGYDDQVLIDESEVSAGDPDDDRPKYDFQADSEMICAAFQQAYGIDLTTEYVHWHRFKALFKCLPDSTMMSKVIGYRSAKTSDKLSDAENDEIRRLHGLWDLPVSESVRLAHEAEVEKWK